jgi:hypothetical protein
VWQDVRGKEGPTQPVPKQLVRRWLDPSTSGLPRAGCWLLAAGCWLLAAGCWPVRFSPRGRWIETRHQPVNFLAVPPSVSNAKEAVHALREAERICLLLSSLHTQRTLRFPALLKVALLQHVFTNVVPTPLPPNARAAHQHPWEFATGLRHGEQLEILLMLQRIAGQTRTRRVFFVHHARDAPYVITRCIRSHTPHATRQTC